MVPILVGNPARPACLCNVRIDTTTFALTLVTHSYTSFSRFCIDTWQYFLHRLFHVNKLLYKHIHSWHHRLYVPYAYGALYNHPLEGFLLDTLGAGLAHLVSLLSVRQSIVLFAFSTMKTIDDHCGYRFSLDPLQLFFANNADYHDIHHQVRWFCPLPFCCCLRVSEIDYIVDIGDWYQVQLLATVLHPLGCYTRHAHDPQTNGRKTRRKEKVLNRITTNKNSIYIPLLTFAIRALSF